MFFQYHSYYDSTSHSINNACLIYLTDRRDLNKLIGNMIKDRKSYSVKISEETLLDCILTYTDDEEIQLADALEFATCGQYVLEYCKLYL